MPYILLVKPIFLLVLVFAFVASLLVSGQSAEPSSCSTFPRCNELGTAALKSGRIDEAIDLFKQQAALAEVADINLQTGSGRSRHRPYTLAVPAYNNLALAYFKKHDYFWGRAWAHVALRWDKDNSAAQFNLREIEQALGKWQWPQMLAGEYVLYGGRGTWETFIVRPASAGNIEFCFSGLWWGRGEGPSGIGDLHATVPIHDNQAEYSTHEFGEKECRISMKFSPDKLEVKQIGDDFDCGFGHNVTANGTFERISSEVECTPEER